MSSEVWKLRRNRSFSFKGTSVFPAICGSPWLDSGSGGPPRREPPLSSPLVAPSGRAKPSPKPSPSGNPAPWSSGSHRSFPFRSQESGPQTVRAGEAGAGARGPGLRLPAVFPWSSPRRAASGQADPGSLPAQGAGCRVPGAGCRVQGAGPGARSTDLTGGWGPAGSCGVRGTDLQEKHRLLGRGASRRGT